MGSSAYSDTLHQPGVPNAGPGRAVVGILSALFALAGCTFYMRGSSLIDPLPTISLVWAFSVGALIGLLLIYLSPLPMKPHLYFTLPIAFGLLAIPNWEATVEYYAFHNVEPKTTQRLALIVGTFSGGGKSTACEGVEVQAYAGARSVSIRTARTICNSVSNPYWAHPPMCFLIDVETGRNGFERASAPSNEDRRRPCPGA